MSSAQIAALQAAAARAAALRQSAAPAPAPASSAPVVEALAAPSSAGSLAAAPETVRRDKPKVGRNDPCWCGSGKKYKNCHMREDQAGGGAVG